MGGGAFPLVIAGVLALLVLASIPYVIFPVPICEVDPDSREIIVHRYSLRRRPPDRLPLAQIRLFVAHRLYWGSDNHYSSCYAVMASGVTYPVIPELGSVSPARYAKALGYLCQKLAVEVTEEEPSRPHLSLWEPAYGAQRGKPVDVVGLLSVARVLYDPSSGTCWSEA
jgi:hypothetical protein